MPHAAVDVRHYISGSLFPRADNQEIHVVIEDYRVYSWKTKDHAWAGLHTSRLIGATELICYDAGLDLTKQTAQQAKGFCTDDKLQAWGLWQEGQRHARDAIRHALYYLLFRVAKLQEAKK